METNAFSSTSILINVDADAHPDLIVLNTDCEAPPPPAQGGGPRSTSGRDPGDIGIVDVDKGAVDISRTALSRCLSHHRVFLNKADEAGRRFVHDAARSTQLDERLGPLQQVVGPVKYLIVDLDGDDIADLVTGNVDDGRSDLALDQRSIGDASRVPQR